MKRAAGMVGWLPGGLRRWVLAFEAQIESWVRGFAADLPPGALLLDAGAGEGRYRHFFPKQRYVGLDLGVGDTSWDYGELDVVGDLAALPFPDASMDAVLSVVTLEHVRQPAQVIEEMSRVLREGGRMLLVVPQEWEVHQHPHDFFRFTRYGVEMLVRGAGLEIERLEPAGGYFRLLSRRLLEGGKVVPFPLAVIWVLLTAPVALALPLADRLDRDKDHTLGYLTLARKGFGKTV